MSATQSKRTLAWALAAGITGAVAGLGIGYLSWGWPTNWYAPRDVTKLPATPENELIRYGWQLVVETPRLIGKNAADPAKRFAGNDLACTQCHMNAGLKPFAAPLISTFGSFPMMTNDQVLTLAERVNGCMTRSMNGKPLPEDGREMDGFIAYLRYIGRDTPQSVRIAGMGLKPLRAASQKPDQSRGEQVYVQTCTRCHGASGQGELRSPPGVGYSVPPLWGSDSFNAAAGMSRLDTAAAFIHANMPYETEYRNPQLTEQQAWDVAAYVTAQPRPPAPAAGSR